MIISRGLFKYLQITVVVAISITSRNNHQSGANPFAMAFSKGDVRGRLLAELRAKKRISLSEDYAFCMNFLVKKWCTSNCGAKYRLILRAVAALAALDAVDAVAASLCPETASSTAPRPGAARQAGRCCNAARAAASPRAAVAACPCPSRGGAASRSDPGAPTLPPAL